MVGFVGFVGQGVGSVGLSRSKGVAGLDLNFVNGRYALNSPYSSAFPPGWSFARIGAGTALTSAGVVVPFATNVPRIMDRGLLVEGARTNKCSIRNATPVTAAANITKTGDAAAVLTLETDTAALAAAGLSGVVGQVWRLNNTAGVATAVVAVDGATTNTNAHTCSAYVRGSGDVRVRLNGISNTATPLTSAYVRRTTTQTPPDSGNLLSIWIAAGADCYFTLPQLEEGSFATSPIITTGAAGTRGADSATITGLNIPAPYTIIVDLIPLQVSGMDVVNTGTSLANGVGLYINSGVPNGVGFVREASATTATIVTANTATANVATKLGGRFAVNDTNVALNGTVGTVDTSVAPPTITQLNLSRLAYGFQGVYASAIIQRMRILPYALSDAELQALTT